MLTNSSNEMVYSWLIAVLLVVVGLLFLWFYQRQRQLRREIAREGHREARREAQLWAEIDRRREVESRLEGYQAKLEEMVAERTRALEESQVELQAQSLEVGRAQLAAMVLHNIGNAMTPVTIFVEELKDSDSESLLAYLGSCFAELQEHVNDLNRFIHEDERGRKIFSYSADLIEELKLRQEQRALQVSEIEIAVNRVVEILLLQQDYASGAQDDPTPVDCNAVIEDALKFMEGSFAKRQIVVKKELETPPPSVFVEKGGLMRLLVFLLKNSCEAISERFATGLEAHGERLIVIVSRVVNGKFLVTLSDTGIGLNPDECESVFTFGHSAKGASGFGLYYCREWIEKHHGRISLTSSGQETGTRVEICLPLHI